MDYDDLMGDQKPYKNGKQKVRCPKCNQEKFLKLGSEVCGKCLGEQKYVNESLSNYKATKSAQQAILDETLQCAGGDIPHSADALEVFLKHYGGLEELMKDYAGSLKSLVSTGVNPSKRIKAFEAAFRMILANAQLGGAKKPTSLMTKEDLEKQVKLVMQGRDSLD